MAPTSRGLLLGCRTCNGLRRTRWSAWRGSNRQSYSQAPPRIQLRKYQEECIEAVLSSLKLGRKRLGVSLATGSGKTVIFTRLIERVAARNGKATQTLILAHRQELVEQAAKHCRSAYPDKNVEIEMGVQHASGRADITIASIASIISSDRMLKFDPRRFKLVLVDEAHHIVAPGYLKTLEYFGLSHEQEDSPALVGVSATLSRFDGIKLGTALDHIVYHKDYIDMIGEKWLSDVIFTTVRSKADISHVGKDAHGDFKSAELSKAVNTEETNDITFRSWLAKAGARKSTMIFCCDLAHVAGLTNTFRQNGVDARFITGATKKRDRSERLDAFRRREYPVLVNCAVFTEGTDVPNIDCVVLARPTKSRNLLVQMIGRGMRLYEGKKNCHIIDMVASLETGIITTPTLFGLDHSELVEEANVDNMKTIKATRDAEEQRNRSTATIQPRSKDHGPRSSSVVITDYDSVFDLVEDTMEDQHIRKLSPHSWVCVAPDTYILANSTGTFLKLEKNAASGDEIYVVSETVALPPNLSKAPFARPRTILEAATFYDAVHGADTYASKKYPHQFISTRQAWRKKDATEGQLTFLNKLRSKEDQLTADRMSKGMAADMITKFKHGARGRFAGIAAIKRKQERSKLKTEQAAAMAQREVVRIGPLLSK